MKFNVNKRSNTIPIFFYLFEALLVNIYINSIYPFGPCNFWISLYVTNLETYENINIHWSEVTQVIVLTDFLPQNTSIFKNCYPSQAFRIFCQILNNL